MKPIMATGLMEFPMVVAFRRISMVPFMTESTNMAKRKETVSTHGLKTNFTRDNSIIICSMGRVPTSTKMDISTLESG